MEDRQRDDLTFEVGEASAGNIGRVWHLSSQAELPDPIGEIILSLYASGRRVDGFALLTEAYLDTVTSATRGKIGKLTSNPRMLVQAEDLAHEALIAADKNLSDPTKPKVEKLRPWLLGLTGNHCYSAMRHCIVRDKYTRLQWGDDQVDERSDGVWETERTSAMESDNSVNSEATVNALRKCMQKLEDRPRRIVQFYYGKPDATFKKLGEHVGIQASGAKKALDKVLAALRNCTKREVKAQQNLS